MKDRWGRGQGEGVEGASDGYHDECGKTYCEMNVLSNRCLRQLFLCRKGSVPFTPKLTSVKAQRALSGATLVEVSPKSIQPYLRLMRIDKPTGFWLLYWPCTWSIALAAAPGSLPDLKMLALFGAGSILMRSAGCIMNDIFDKDYDRMVERTQSRPLASGELNNLQAVALLALLLSGSLSILLQFTWFSVAVGASSLPLVVVYPFAKRYTYWPQFVLGLTSNWGVFIAWCHLCPSTLLTVIPLYTATVFYTATYDTIYSHQDLIRTTEFCISHSLYCSLLDQTMRVKNRNGVIIQGLYNTTDSTGLAFNWGVLLGWAVIRDELCIALPLLYMASVNWTLIYDTIYAHQDKTDDLIAGIKSTALLFGDKTKYWLTGFAVLTILGFGTTGVMVQQTWPFYGTLAATGIHLAWQIGAVDINDPKDCWKKFKTNQWLGAILFTGIVAGNLLRKEEKGEANCCR
ncbi:4-hydroxybenzoate polyprenyl transferase [Loa loa]|uniref:4-hydroxybenzoate polyprenyltransferase, mitochondrial n=1 Tax=Loa loa TaxID=7209 RepID=A0A1S0U116_LOALO|nr:4-hydroxybenzoate polyprenyl transferase [Loa loa]EFO22690.1 4-hydroxybenzoate polyprenyl transferase [Loa loa]